MKLVIVAFGSFLILFAIQAMADPGQLYGKIYTKDNEILEGFIRWDKNEASWDDVLDGNKELDSRHHKRYVDSNRRRKGSLKIFGINIDDGENYNYFSGDEAQSGIRMGHIKTLTPESDDRATLVLKSGEEVELGNGSTDIGSDIRELLIDDKTEGIVDLIWDDIDRIEFEATPTKESEFGKRLYGTATTRRGDKYTGFICWDADETFDTDIIDGQERSRKRKIEFSRIKSIERRTSESSVVVLKDGKEMRLEGTNDIDSGNRGIVVSDPNLGRLSISWDEFDILELKDAPSGLAYSSYDGGKKLRGTVYTENGEKFTGDIKWDDDEEYTWELLNGNFDDIELAIEMANLKAIEKISSRGSLVTLKDGRTFKLRDSNDIDDGNKGIIIKTAKDEVEVDWEDFNKVEFSN
jgi:hypothetical protein